MLIQEKLLKTPLYDEHVALKAKMVPLGGWSCQARIHPILAERQELGAQSVGNGYDDAGKAITVYGARECRLKSTLK